MKAVKIDLKEETNLKYRAQMFEEFVHLYVIYQKTAGSLWNSFSDATETSSLTADLETKLRSDQSMLGHIFYDVPKAKLTCLLERLALDYSNHTDTKTAHGSVNALW